jgi:hypothetical protein
VRGAAAEQSVSLSRQISKGRSGLDYPERPQKHYGDKPALNLGSPVSRAQNDQSLISNSKSIIPCGEKKQHYKESPMREAKEAVARYLSLTISSKSFLTLA